MVVASPERRVHVVRHESADGRWELTRTRPAARLAAHVTGYCGYHEATPAPALRRELPGPQVVFILDLGPTLRLHDERSATPQAYASGFVAGLDERSTLTETSGEQHGIQIDLDLAGASALLGVPLVELTGRAVALDDLYGVAEVRRLRDQIQSTADWHRRFAVLDRFFGDRLARTGAAPPAAPDWLDVAWRRVRDSGGLLSIDALADELGYSRKHVSVRFRERFGLSPKRLARLVRFDRAVRLLRSGTGTSLAQIGLQCGYFDQAHFIREFREFAGETPGAYFCPWPLAEPR